mmetsp:Transcript_18667/g.13531  ORF Transcript_18667/g.13531 Transcript_18667/m.13531 type:complete len:119 (+) Transcript_18667:676-1032(+)
MDKAGLVEEGRIQLRVIDIPWLHKMTIKDEYGNDSVHQLYAALMEMANDDFEMLRKGAVRALIEMRWDQIYYRIVLFHLLPYFVFLAIFLWYTNYDYMSYSHTKCREESAKKAASIFV